jgi:hypothetical protein
MGVFLLVMAVIALSVTITYVVAMLRLERRRERGVNR